MQLLRAPSNLQLAVAGDLALPAHMRMTLPASRHSDKMFVTRLSSSPRSFAPATSRPTSNESTRLPAECSGCPVCGRFQCLTHKRIVHAGTSLT